MRCLCTPHTRTLFGEKGGGYNQDLTHVRLGAPTSRLHCSGMKQSDEGYQLASRALSNMESRYPFPVTNSNLIFFWERAVARMHASPHKLQIVCPTAGHS